jgi:hypothetical protein
MWLRLSVALLGIGASMPTTMVTGTVLARNI